MRSSRPRNSQGPSRPNMIGSAGCFVMARIRLGKKFRLAYWTYDLFYNEGC